MSGCASDTGVEQFLIDTKVKTVAIYKMNRVWEKDRIIPISKDTLRKDSITAVKIINNLKQIGL